MPLERVMHFSMPRDGPEKARMRGGGPKRLNKKESLRSDNEAGGPFPDHPTGGTESAHLRRRNGSKGHLDPALAIAPSIWADSVPSRGMIKCITRSKGGIPKPNPRSESYPRGREDTRQRD